MSRVRRVRAEGVDLHVVEDGEPGRPPVLLVHGFPDDHEVYSRVVPELARDFHVARFDLRGVGASSAPASPSGYRIDAVIRDLDAVIDATFGTGARAHVVGHDWGSILAFSYVADAIGSTRARSFTSVSGPHLGIAWSTMLRSLRSSAHRGGALRQLASSWYTLAFHAPFAPSFLASGSGMRAMRRALIEGGVPLDDPYLDVSSLAIASRTRHAIELYRQNMLRPPPAPRAIDVPTLVVIPERDPFVRPEVHAFLGEHAKDLEVRRLDAGHWVPRSHPRWLASAIREFTARVDARKRGASEEVSR
ncbi:alpha/beta fold hydrolase [Sandaracinus amylolyticus]|uniref:alpha/beta fold hydrolase n=1 Tax=Sandaracinus amylolyticus TaxID=927083 RepID=UPI001F221A25|nr:alpha/beta fold hydrolase [Sandaracinus amylolyticus]UJR86999.1 Hypothetical protein I5071_91000 [Sandaracinus amylolyticus]